MGAVLARGGVFEINAVGRGILADHQKFAHAVLHQLFGLADHRMGGAALQKAAHVGDDAELALVVTALGNLEIAVVARRQADGAGGQEIDERVGLGGHGLVDGVEHGLVLVRAGDGEDLWMRAGDVFGFGPQTAGDDDTAVFTQCLADGLKAFGLGAVEKAAGVDDHRIGALVIGRDGIALGAQARQDALSNPQAPWGSPGRPCRWSAGRGGVPREAGAWGRDRGGGQGLAGADFATWAGVYPDLPAPGRGRFGFALQAGGGKICGKSAVPPLFGGCGGLCGGFRLWQEDAAGTGRRRCKERRGCGRWRFAWLKSWPCRHWAGRCWCSAAPEARDRRLVPAGRRGCLRRGYFCQDESRGRARWFAGRRG